MSAPKISAIVSAACEILAETYATVSNVRNSADASYTVILRHVLPSLTDSPEITAVTNALTALETLDVALKALPHPMADYRETYLAFVADNRETAADAFANAKQGIVSFIANGERMGFSSDEITLMVESLAGVTEDEDSDADVGDGDPHAAWTKRVRAWGMRKGLAKSRGQLSETVKRLYVKANPTDVEPVKSA